MPRFFSKRGPSATGSVVRDNCRRDATRVRLVGGGVVVVARPSRDKEPEMRHARFAGWMMGFVLICVVGVAALRLSAPAAAAAEDPAIAAARKVPAPAAPAAPAALAALQVSAAPNGGLVVFDASTGEVLRVTTGDKPAVEPVGTLRRSDAGRWEFVRPATGAPAAAAAPVLPEAARATAAKADVIVLMTALKAYRNDTGKFPATEEGLQSLIVQSGGVDNWKGPYVKGEIPKDPWGNPFIYRNPGKQNPSGVDVVSFGPDTRDGGGDDIHAP
jgi:type II secretion system protein G